MTISTSGRNAIIAVVIAIILCLANDSLRETDWIVFNSKGVSLGVVYVHLLRLLFVSTVVYGVIGFVDAVKNRRL